MNLHSIINVLIIIFSYLLVFIVGEISLKYSSDKIISRKISHILGGLVTFCLPYFVGHYTAVSVGLAFFVLLIIAQSKGLIKSVNDDCPSSHGAILFPLGLALLAYFFWHDQTVFQAAVLILTFSDGLAGLIGQKIHSREYTISGKKTSLGTLVFFIITYIVLCIFYLDHSVLIILGVSVFITLAEATFSKGWDNLVVPLVSAIMISCFL
jgi:phytol kinase